MSGMRAQKQALCALLLFSVVQVSQLQYHERRTVLVGEDADFDVKSWSKQHQANVGRGKLDSASVKSIWATPNSAWKGIDDILPTGGRYAYEDDHQNTANEAKRLHFLEVAKKQEAMKTAMSTGPSKQAKEAKEAKKSVLVGEMRTIAADQRQLQSPGRVAEAKVAMAQVVGGQMLSLSQGKQGRVFEDDALYGEGILGDIQSQGHHAAHWSAQGAASDMKSYFSKLSVETATKEAASHSRNPKVLAWGGNDKGMHGYWKELSHRSRLQQDMHKAILANDHYYEQHPFEHKDLHKWVRSSWESKAALAQSAPSVGDAAGSKAASEWQAKHGIPKTADDLAAFAQYEVKFLGAH